MAPDPVLDEQRLAFGRVAGLYDRARPSYPPAVIDAVMRALPPPADRRTLEVGTGTGKATSLLAQRGLRILGLEPDREMAAVARRKCARHTRVEIFESDFEHWPVDEQFAAVVSFQAWHWVDANVRYLKAAEAVMPEGVLLAVWMFPDWRRCAARPALSTAYASAAPGLDADFPMHPDSQPDRLAGDWSSEIAQSPGFGRPAVTHLSHQVGYSASEYTDLLRTHQDHILLAPARREQLLDAIARAIHAAGGQLLLPLKVWVCSATRSPED